MRPMSDQEDERCPRDDDSIKLSMTTTVTKRSESMTATVINIEGDRIYQRPDTRRHTHMVRSSAWAGGNGVEPPLVMGRVVHQRPLLQEKRVASPASKAAG